MKYLAPFCEDELTIHSPVSVHKEVVKYCIQALIRSGQQRARPEGHSFCSLADVVDEAKDGEHGEADRAK